MGLPLEAQGALSNLKYGPALVEGGAQINTGRRPLVADFRYGIQIPEMGMTPIDAVLAPK